MARDRLGGFELRVLVAILHLQGQGYAITIANEVERRTGRSASLGAIYATVDRLERKGFVSSRLGDPTPERGGKPKRFYQVKAPGVMALSVAREADERMWTGIPPLGVPA